MFTLLFLLKKIRILCIKESLSEKLWRNDERKAGIFVNKLSEIIKKRATLGIAVFCITAIATVGVLSQGDSNKENTPDSFVDLNESPEKEEQQQVAQSDTSELKTSEQQITEEDSNLQEQEQQIAKEQEVTDSKNTEQQVVNNKSESETIDSSMQMSQKEEIDIVKEEQTEETQVSSPQLIAEQLTFDKVKGLLYPVQEGEIIIPYSPDHGVFHFTLEQFSTSDAVVLSSSVGMQVKSSAKGVVTAIEEDDRIGTTVTIAIGNNTSLVYGQLELNGLKEGDIVEAGQCIGTVAEPTRYYVVEGPNLYFQVLEGEESLDPTLLFTESE